MLLSKWKSSIDLLLLFFSLCEAMLTFTSMKTGVYTYCALLFPMGIQKDSI